MKKDFCYHCWSYNKIKNMCIRCGKIDEICPACKTVNSINDEGFCEYCGYTKNETDRTIH